MRLLDVAAEIRALVLEWEPDARREGWTPDEHDGPALPEWINQGDCEPFAEGLRERLRECHDEHAVLTLGSCEVGAMGEEDDHSSGPVHVWLFVRGRHRDAEAPDGVEDWRALPFFRRWYASGRYPEPQGPYPAQRYALMAVAFAEVSRWLMREARSAHSGDSR